MQKKMIEKRLKSEKIKFNYTVMGTILILIGLIFSLLYWQLLTKQKLDYLTSKFRIEKIQEIININEENRGSSFMEGESEKYALFSGPFYYKKCLIETNAQNIEDLDDIGDFEYLPTYSKKELNNFYKNLPISIPVIKIETEDFSQVKCDGFIWNEKDKELYYNEKPVRFIIKNAKPSKD